MRSRIGKDALLRTIQDFIDRRYPSWNLDAALRYLPIAEHLNRSKPDKVLDVGCAGTGLSLYWGRKTIGLDLHMAPGEIGPLIFPVKGTGFALPFKDRSVDAVVSADVLEHVPLQERTTALYEMIRVAHKYVIVAVPCGHASFLAEVEVDEIYQKKTGASHPWLKEHLWYGLPEARLLVEEIRAIAARQGKNVRIEVRGNMNLALWRWLFGHYFGGGPRTARIIRYYLLALIPLLKHINWGNTYRKIFFVQLN